MIWEVFRQDRKGQPLEHAGSGEAPDADFAEAWAREQYGRRGESVALWLVPREKIHAVGDWADGSTSSTAGSTATRSRARLKEARERAAARTG
jgi:phenylacetate-CoA oxygenase PaaH subunit